MNHNTFADQWKNCAEYQLWFVVEIQAEILLSPAQLCIYCPCSRPMYLLSFLKVKLGTSTWICYPPKKVGCVHVNLSKQLSRPAWNNIKKRPIPWNFFLLRSAGSLSWHLICPISYLSPTVILPRRVSFAILTSPTQKCHLGRVWGFSAFVHDFWLAQYPETTEMLTGSTHLKIWFFGSGRGLILVHGLHRWSAFLLYVWHAQDVSLWRTNTGAVS